MCFVGFPSKVVSMLPFFFFVFLGGMIPILIGVVSFSNLAVISKGGHDRLEAFAVNQARKNMLLRLQLDNLGILKIPRPFQ